MCGLLGADTRSKNSGEDGRGVACDTGWLPGSSRWEPRPPSFLCTLGMSHDRYLESQAFLPSITPFYATRPCGTWSLSPGADDEGEAKGQGSLFISPRHPPSPGSRKRQQVPGTTNSLPPFTSCIDAMPAAWLIGWLRVHRLLGRVGGARYMGVGAALPFVSPFPSSLPPLDTHGRPLCSGASHDCQRPRPDNWSTQSALDLSSLIRERSKDSQLLVINLPDPSKQIQVRRLPPPCAGLSCGLSPPRDLIGSLV